MTLRRATRPPRRTGGRLRLAVVALLTGALTACLATVTVPSADAAHPWTPNPSPPAAGSPAPGGPMLMPRPDWPTGRTSTGQHVSWTAPRARHASYRQATGWWGAATTKIRIHGPAAPHVYAFHLHLPKHVSLGKNRFGEVVATRRGHPVGILGRPWAKDSRGHHLTTWYSVHRHVVRQHVRFGPRTRFPVTADPWWNPFSWQWHSIFSIAWSQIKTCGEGAVKTIEGLGTVTGTMNLLLVHVADRAAVMVPGGAYGYAAMGVYGCIGSYFGNGRR